MSSFCSACSISLRLKGVGLLADTQELDRFAGDMADRQRRTTAGITIDLGQDDPGQRQGFIEGLGGIGRVLTGHGIDHEQGLGRFGRRVHCLDLLHHVRIDVQTTGGIDDQHVHEAAFRFTQGGVDDIHGLLAEIGGEEGDAHLAGQGLQLLDRRRTVDVGTDHHDLLLLPLAQGLGQFGDTGGLTRALQTGHEDYCRRCYRQVQLLGLAHDRFQFGLDDLDEHLTRRQAAGVFLAHGPVAHLIDEALDHRQRHVRLKQRHAHFAQGVLDIVFSQLGATGDTGQGTGQAFGKIFKHQRILLGPVDPCCGLRQSGWAVYIGVCVCAASALSSPRLVRHLIAN